MKKQLKLILSFSFLFLTSLLLQSCTSNQGTLSVEAGLVYKAGDVKPVARTDFYLLDDSLENILKNAQIKPLIKEITPLQNFAVLQRGKKMPEVTDETKSIIAQADNAIKPHIVGTVTTDFNGKAQFENVKPGKYFLMGAGGTENQAIVWSLPVEVKSGNQSITLDNKNSVMIF